MKSVSRLAPLLGVVACALLNLPSASAHPIVPGFERFYTDPKGDILAGGQLLLSELNCTSCHASAESNAKKQAPILDDVGGRIRPGYFKKFLNDPHGVKPGTTMPTLFTNDPNRDHKIEALTHYLASTGTVSKARPDLKAIIRGRDLFAKVGCAACHGSRDLVAEPKAPFPYAVPLGDLKEKYTLPGLTQFLTNPLKSRPAGRMPHLLKSAEAKDVANYLLQGLKTNLTAGKGTTTYSYYEGGWDNLPNFDRLKPKKQGSGIAFELGVAEHGSNYALRFQGYFSVEAAGKYTFHIASDDGSRLAIDGRVVVNNDGIHPTKSESGSVELTKGVHQVQVDFFQGGGEAVLEVELEGRGLARQPLAPLVASKESDLNIIVDPKLPLDEDTLVIKQQLVAEGKRLFASEGCASCHQSKDKALASTKKARPLNQLKADGCLSAKPIAGLPAYSLNEAQVKALQAALPKPIATDLSPTASIARTMTTFNCYGCHVRDKVGGHTEQTNALFQTTTPEMGEEGRIPPPIDGIGAKLNPDYFHRILDQGADDRPYMHTRMPGFGKENVGHLPKLFEGLDQLPAVAPIKFTETESKVRSAGRQLVGAQAFGCIKCHTFAGNKAEGVQGIDMTLMTQRLKRDWFHAYCIDPQKIRPGTRMPTAWPGGHSVLPSVLDGQAATQIEAIWVYLGTKGAPIPVGMGAKFIPLMPITEAIIYRNFIRDAGTRAIGVGYPEKVHLAFDANDLRLAMIWKGGFIDAARHWTDRGVGFEGPLGDEVVHFPQGPAFALLPKSDSPWPKTSARENGFKFLGYSLAADDRPTFRYALPGATIEDFPNPTSKDNLHRTLTLKAEKGIENLYFRVGSQTSIKKHADGSWQLEGIRIKAANAEVRAMDGKETLVIPVKFKDGITKIELDYSW
jgi:mono/diheme cytochrome c family protein